MSRLSNILNMYMILQGRHLVKVKDLAEIIEVSPRSIKEYRKDLEKAGIYIGSKSGRYGGYYLESKMDLKGLSITKEELESLKMASEIIKSGNHMFALDFEIFTSKIINVSKDFEGVDYFNKDNLKSLYMKEIEIKWWNQIKRAIISKKKINMAYITLDKKIKKEKGMKRIIHPYGTFDHDGAAYFFGYCETRKEVRYFKLSRIEDIINLNEEFTINIGYDIKRIMRESFGIMDDDMFYLKLKISYPMSQLVKEKQYTANQIITEIDEENIIFEANLKGYQEVKTWVLGMGSKVKVIEPQRLKKDILKEIGILEKLYN